MSDQFYCPCCGEYRLLTEEIIPGQSINCTICGVVYEVNLTPLNEPNCDKEETEGEMK